MPNHLALTLVGTSLALLLLACEAKHASTASESNQADGTSGATGLANPASKHCAEVGGTLVITTRDDGGEYGVCDFEDNRLCEEWALLRGDCPVGGVKVTGYATPQARYCAISGGRYSVTAVATAATPEQGNCRLPDGRNCAAKAYYAGTC